MNLQQALVILEIEYIDFGVWTLSSFKEKAKHQYRKLSRIHHPDLGGKAEKFIVLNSAWEYIQEMKTLPRKKRSQWEVFDAFVRYLEERLGENYQYFKLSRGIHIESKEEHAWLNYFERGFKQLGYITDKIEYVPRKLNYIRFEIALGAINGFGDFPRERLSVYENLLRDRWHQNIKRGPRTRR